MPLLKMIMNRLLVHSALLYALLEVVNICQILVLHVLFVQVPSVRGSVFRVGMCSWGRSTGQWYACKVVVSDAMLEHSMMVALVVMRCLVWRVASVRSFACYEQLCEQAGNISAMHLVRRELPRVSCQIMPSVLFLMDIDQFCVLLRLYSVLSNLNINLTHINQ